MGNKILGRRSRSFYKGFNERQLDYIRQKFEMISNNGVLDLKRFCDSYKVPPNTAKRYFQQVDFDENQQIDEYEFICSVHSLCSCTIEQLGGIFYRILTKAKSELKENTLLEFTKICLQYNAYLQKQEIKQATIKQTNRHKFQKYDFNHDNSINEAEFVKICMKDEDYKMWMFNMGFVSKRQLEFQEDIYDLVDSDICEEIDRNEKKQDEDQAKIKKGIEHRIEEEEFNLEETVGEQSAPVVRPWLNSVSKIKIDLENPQSPSQSLQMDYIFGYRSFDCRNNVKFDSKGRIVYHQAAVGIVMEPRSKEQSFLIEHHDDISCLDLVGDTVVTGEVGAKPQVVLWETNKIDNILKEKLIITEQLRDSVCCVALSAQKDVLAVVCNNNDHNLILYDLTKMFLKQKHPTSTEKTILASGSTTKSVIFDMKFDTSGKRVVIATLRQLLFITFQKGTLNANRGAFGNFTVSPTVCVEPMPCRYKGEKKQFMLSGMGNGSIYFWEQEKCVKAVCGHTGLVSALCRRKDCESFVSGDKSGRVIIWNDKFQKEKTLDVQKTNCPSNMVVSLSCSPGKQLLIGTKSSNIYKLPIGSSFNDAQQLMSGHSDGHLWALTIHRTQPYLYTGGEDQRLIKWEYVKQRRRDKQRKCPYKIRSIDFNSRTEMLIVGYSNGVIECFNADSLQRTGHSYEAVKNPDEQALNLVKFNKDATLCAVCYQLPEFKVVLLAIGESKMKLISQLPMQSKVIALDFSNDSKIIQLNSSKFEYIVYDIADEKKPKLKPLSGFVLPGWATHTIPFSPETQGLMTEGVKEQDIVCCERNRKHRNVFVTGDKYSKIKLFNYPSKDNKIFNKYGGHSNDVTGLQFSRDHNILVSIGGEQKSIIIWKYDPELVENEWFIKQLEPESDLEEAEITQARKAKIKQMDEFTMEEEVGEQALAVKPFLGQIKNPSDFQEKYNTRRDNVPPKQSVQIRHAFGIRNRYLNDQVRNQCKFTKNSKEIVFPTACLGVKMSITTRQQTFYHEHKEDVVSFAVDDKREIMATGQMAQKNQRNPRKKILAIHVWDIEGHQLLQKLDGFHTIAIVLLSFSPSSKFLFTCGHDDKNTFAVYDWMSGSIVYSGPVSRAKVNGISWKNDNEFITCGMDHVKFWTGKKSMLGRIKGKSEGMFSCLSSKRVYLTGSGDGGIYNWLGNACKDKIKAHGGKVHTLVFFKDYVYSGGDDGKVLAWRTEANGEVKVSDRYYDTRNAFQSLFNNVNIPQQEFAVLSIDFNDQKELLVVTKGASVILYANKNSQIVHQGHWKGELWALSTQISKGNDHIIVTGGDDKTVRLWDLNQHKEINRIYFDNKIRGIDWSTDGDRKIVIADSRAKLYLYDRNLSQMHDEYIGKPYDFNKNQKRDPWVEEIKFSPDNKLIAYGCHGKSMYMELVKVMGSKLKLHKTFTHGSSAVLHLDWDVHSSQISMNTQAYELLFYDGDGQKVYASATADTNYATWTQKFGFPVQGIFQGVDYSDVNTVCRDPNREFLAVGYDDQCIRLFKYPCYIQKQSCKTFTGHSSHVTRVKFTSQLMVSLGGLDRTVLVWDVERPGEERQDDGEESDGLEDLDDTIDIPGKALQKKEKPKKIEEFYEEEDVGDEFMAIKPWLGAIKQPTYEYPEQSPQKPTSKVVLQYVQGYRCKDCRQNLYYADKDTLIFHAAAVLIYHTISNNSQTILDPHNDDILSIDYHKESNQVITGELGPKPYVCLFKDGVLDKVFAHPVRKGVIAIAISPDGTKAVCAGIDDDHHISALDLTDGRIIKTVKGTKKVIMKMVWVSNHEFVTLGINHFRLWTLNGRDIVGGKESRKRVNIVSVVFDQDTGTVFAGASKGEIIPYTGGSPGQVVSLKKAQKNASVVDSLLIHRHYLLAGTKDGMIFVLDKASKKVLNTFQMQAQFRATGVKSECAGIRSMCIEGNKLVVGTLGAEIYEFKFDDLQRGQKIGNGVNILKCHYSPNNTWTNEVWGLDIHQDFIFTCSDDATLRCWSLSQKKLISCVSTNVGKDNIPLPMDKKTRDYKDAAKSRAVGVNRDGSQVVVGAKDGTVRIFTFSQTSGQLKFKTVFKHAKEWISDIKFGYGTLVIGSHDNGVYVYNYHPEEKTLKRKFRPMKKHSSYITHMDVSRDSCFLQSTCGAYELLFWDLNTGKQITSGATMLRDELWSSWTCNLGWPVQGIYPKCTDGTFINSVDRSHTSVNKTRIEDDPRSPYLLAAGNDNGNLAIYHYPCTIKSSKFVQGRGHSSHVTNVKWSEDDRHILTVGGQDQCLMYWRVDKK